MNSSGRRKKRRCQRTVYFLRNKKPPFLPDKEIRPPTHIQWPTLVLLSIQITGRQQNNFLVYCFWFCARCGCTLSDGNNYKYGGLQMRPPSIFNTHLTSWCRYRTKYTRSFSSWANSNSVMKNVDLWLQSATWELLPWHYADFCSGEGIPGNSRLLSLRRHKWGWEDTL